MSANLPLSAEICFEEPAHPALRLSVIIPAKDEADFITTTLDALRMQVDKYENDIPDNTYEVLVLTNNCSDDTFEICQCYQAKYPHFRLFIQNVVLAPSIAHIGTVRRLLMDAAYKRLSFIAGYRGIIVSTDADSEVDSQWIYHIISEMDKGVDVVGGRILPRATPILSRIHHLRDVAYRFLRTRLEAELDPCQSNPWPRHFQCYGPSLAVTCDIYDRAGRLPAIPYLEDEEFRKALKRIDAKIRHAPNVRIYTSSRLVGRVDFGFSVQLQQWTNMSLNKEQQMVESLQSVYLQLGLKHDLRKLWLAIIAGRDVLLEINALAFKLQCDGEELYMMLTTSAYFESLWEKIELQLVQLQPSFVSLQPISVAIEDFRAYFSKRTTTKPSALINAIIPVDLI
ncbi:glycosyltransferase [Pedobacter frigidisoli]|uniref:Glycosyltransferase n=1 Tax=Pedobacter frigidisoli TaxID=2530455 RepID=A0A4R0NYU4_9SPHI|nr:glycosyltransferase [Pedobacter frigidisoli]TCD07591.1 glycosyltransferase [Pedobacter frigidisoli]